LSKVSSQAGDKEASILALKPTSKAKHFRKKTTVPQDKRLDSGTEWTRLRISFPHAFERWETISAHWEGLTVFWIRRLEANSAEINKDPLAQQLTRQITDLSAAGSNPSMPLLSCNVFAPPASENFRDGFSRLERSRSGLRRKKQN
jgi:hypothetical protein